MTTTQQAGGASAVDFAAFGDYGDFRRKQPQPATGEFVRSAYPFRGRIAADGSSGYPAVAGRYHLYISWACPWAHRTAIVRKLLGLQEAISLSRVDPVRDAAAGRSARAPGTRSDPVNGFSLLREAYQATEPGSGGHTSVPVLWDRETGRIVSNNFPDITIDLDTRVRRVLQRHGPIPAGPAPEIDAINAVVYETVNNGVYRSGMATSQEAYHDAVSRVFATLDDLEQRLAGRRYLLGDAITEADVRLWVTLARLQRGLPLPLQGQPAPADRLPEPVGLRARPVLAAAFRDTTNFGHIKRHYYTTHPHINPTRIVPDGPLLDWAAPHDRALS